MISKAILLSLALSLGAGAAVQSRDLERVLPNPSWVVSNARDLGLDAGRLRGLRQDLQASRRALATRRDEIEVRRETLRALLSAPSFDRARIEAEFESLLEVENAMKREALAVRLDFLSALTHNQRARVQDGASRAADQRAVLRARIEQIRRVGRRIRATGGDFEPLRDRVRRIERLIRAGDLRQALELSDRVLDELDR